MNFNDLKSNLLQNKCVETSVQVNQRHLIDKILARYSSEFTIFRELLQNSSDSSSSVCSIYFCKSTNSITFKNNGLVFSQADFERLNKIAEGNPDESKIGFFGVGFYSLFSICDDPFITSGDHSMAFFWKNDMLFTKRGVLTIHSPLTCFFLSCRDQLEIPNLDEFARFLVTSLAFESKISLIEVSQGSREL